MQEEYKKNKENVNIFYILIYYQKKKKNKVEIETRDGISLKI